MGLVEAIVGMIRGTISGIGAVAGGLAAIPFGGIIAFIVGAMVGTIVSDIFWAAIGFPPKTGRTVGIKKGIAASAGSAAGIPLGGVAGMMAGAFAGALIGELI